MSRRLCQLGYAGLLLALLVPPAHAASSEQEISRCGPDALGTTRTLTLKRQFGAWGSLQHAPLALERGEVVLTFDDGPRPETTPWVLKALAEQCVKATFFMIGSNLSQFPDLAHSVAAAGHSVALHSHTHADLKTLTPAEQLTDLAKVEAAYQAVFGHPAAAYRFPMLSETPAMMAQLKEQNIAVFSIDAGIGDWEADVTTEVLVKRLADGLKASGGGIILMHDAYTPLAVALPALLRLLKESGFKIVHLAWQN